MKSPRGVLTLRNAGIAYVGTVFLLGLVRLPIQEVGGPFFAALYLASFPGSVMIMTTIIVSPLFPLLGDASTAPPGANFYILAITSAGARSGTGARG
ncbi:hypothetical protein [Streptomyces sp. NPDC003832]